MDDRIRAIRYENPSHVPVSVGLLPATWVKYGTKLNDIRADFPEIFGKVDDKSKLAYTLPDSYRAGSFTDAWGCVWNNLHEGYESIVVGHPVKTREDIRTLKAPKEDIGLPHGFMFLRLTDLRGFEEMMIDFAEEPPELQMLIDIVCEYNVRQMEKICQNCDDEIIYVGDDNGMQHALPISPAKWRKYLKPAYKAIYDVAKKHGRIVYMHTDGCVWPVIRDMQEAGADIVNPQIRANGLDNLVRECKGRIPINLDLDRQMFPFATPKEVYDHVMECARALYLPEGGLWMAAECAADVPLENIRAICEGLRDASNLKP